MYTNTRRKFLLRGGILTEPGAAFAADLAASSAEYKDVLLLSDLTSALIQGGPFRGALIDSQRARNRFDSGEFFRLHSPEATAEEAKKYIRMYREYMEKLQKEEGKEE